MFWHVMSMRFSPLYLLFGLVFRGEQARVVLALHHRVLVLHRQLGKRPSLVPGERLALPSLLPGKEKLREALLIVKPETLVGWHRAIVRCHWRWLSRGRPCRPAEITPEMERLVRGALLTRAEQQDQIGLFTQSLQVLFDHRIGDQAPSRWGRRGGPLGLAG